MLFLLLKLVMIAIVALLLMPIGLSVALYFSLERKLLLLSVRIFGFNAVRLNLQIREETMGVKLNGKPTRFIDKRKLRKIIEPVIKAIDLLKVDCALQFGTEDAKSTAVAIGTIKGMFLPLKTKCDDANLYVFTDWEKEVGNLGARIDLGITPLKILSKI
ncbi:MAG TPA: DUF2953 domain-containing protein [Clostridia bacterium]|nr:DUF2953 domain-containing protein [Clostridia bacterium]